MPSWTDIPDTEIDPQSELLAGLMTDLRDNADYANVQMAVKTENEGVLNDNALQDDDELTLAFGANGETWAFECQLGIDTTAAAGFKFRLRHSSLVNGYSHYTIFRHNNLSNVEEAAALDVTATAGITVGAADDYRITMRGYLRLNGAGTFKLEWAQNAATVGITTWVYAQASFLIAHRVNW